MSRWRALFFKPDDPAVPPLPDGPPVPPQEPLPAVELFPYARAALPPPRPSPPPTAASAPFPGPTASWAMYGSYATGIPSSRMWPAHYASASAHPWYGRYPPPGPDWERYGPPAFVAVEPQFVGMNSFSHAVNVYAPLGTIVSAEFGLPDGELERLTGYHQVFWQMERIAMDFGGVVTTLEYRAGLATPNYVRLVVQWRAP